MDGSQRKAEVTAEGVGDEVRWSRDVVEPRHITMEALVDPEHSKEVCGDGVGRSAPLSFPEGSIQVVPLAEQGSFAGVHRLSCAVQVNQASRQLKVGVGDRSGGVVRRDDAIGDELGPLQAPQDRDARLPALAEDSLLARKPDATGASPRGIVVPLCNRRQRHELGYPRWSAAQVACQPAEVVQGLMDALLQGDTALLLQAESVLQAPKHVPRAREGNRHRPQLAKDLVPLLDARPLLIPRDAVEDLPQALLAVRGQLNGQVHGVHDPAQNELDRAPRAIPGAEFLHGHWLPSVPRIVAVQGANDLIDGVQESLADTSKEGRLAEGDEVVNEDVDVLQWRGVGR